MNEPPSLQLWADLRSRRPSYEDALETVPASSSVENSLYGMDHRGDLHLLIPVEGPPSSPRPTDLRGLKVRHRQLQDRGEYLDLVSAACHQNVFSPLCAEILNSISVDQRRPWDAVFTTLRAWQAAWKASTPLMEKTAQVGLYGELLVLQFVMIPALGSHAIRHWSGPNRERHDFVGSLVHLEVKTTRKSRHEHEISRADQLSVPPGKRLLVASLLLEESVMGAETLATRIDAVAELLRADPEAADSFQAKLVYLGWSEEMRKTGELLRFYSGFDSVILPVDEQFPRLPDDFQLPSGIVSLKYTIDLANLPGMGLDEVLSQVQDGFPER